MLMMRACIVNRAKYNWMKSCNSWLMLMMWERLGRGKPSVVVDESSGGCPSREDDCPLMLMMRVGLFACMSN